MEELTVDISVRLVIEQVRSAADDLDDVVEKDDTAERWINKRLPIAGWHRSFSLSIGPPKQHRSKYAQVLGSWRSHHCQHSCSSRC
jgi:hypothetical protein